MKRHLTTLAKFAVIIITVLVTACAKDRSLEDYQNDEFNKRLGKLQAINGTYTGLVQALPGGNWPEGTTLGAVKLTLLAQADVQKGSGTSGSSLTPSIHANIEFQNGIKLTVDAQNAEYITESRIFQAEVLIKQGATETKILKIAGFFNGTKISGTIGIAGALEFGGKFELQRDGKALSKLLAENPPPEGLSTLQLGYHGTTQFTSGGSKPVNFSIQNPQTTPEESLLNIFSPTRPVVATFNYGDTARIILTNGYWFKKDGALTGQFPVVRGTQSVTVSVTCTVSPLTQGWHCEYLEPSASTIVAVSDVLPYKGPLPRLPDDSSSRDSVKRDYRGTGQYDPGVWTPTGMSIIYPARTRLDELVDLFAPQFEKTLQVTFFMMNESQTSVNFTAVKWDVVNSSLEATQTEQQAGHNFTRYLSCSGFNFHPTDYDFKCRYSSSLRAFQITLKFSGKGQKKAPNL